MFFVKMVGIVIAIYIVYGVSDAYLNRQALVEAYQFCNAVVIGSAATNLAERAKASGASMGSGSNANLQRFFFPTPIASGFSCDVTVADGKVASLKVTGVKD